MKTCISHRGKIRLLNRNSRLGKNGNRILKFPFISNRTFKRNVNSKVIELFRNVDMMNVSIFKYRLMAKSSNPYIKSLKYNDLVEIVPEVNKNGIKVYVAVWKRVDSKLLKG